MSSRTVPAGEDARLRALQQLDVLDTPPTPAFDDIVRLAASICEAPISLISLIDEDRQWFKANHGLPGVAQTPREQAFCAHTIQNDALLEVSDATADPRFADNPLVTAAPCIRFYAGVPLALATGHRVGSLCVIDRRPRLLSATQRHQLQLLARLAVELLERNRSVASLRLVSRDLLEAYERTPGMLHVTDREGRLLQVSDGWLEALGYERGEVLGRPLGELLSEEARPIFEHHRRALDEQDAPLAPLLQLRTARGRLLDVRFTSIRHAGAIGPAQTITWVDDFSRRRAIEAQLAAERQALASIIQATGVATWQWHIPRNVVIANERWAGLIGYRLHELEPLSIERFSSLIHPDDLPAIEGGLADHFAGRSDVFEVEFRMQHKDGSWVWLLTRGSVMERDGDGAPVEMFGVHLDIADRKRQEAELSLSRELLEATGRIAGVGGWQLDLRTATITWTDETRRIYGVDEDYVPTLQNCLAFYPEESRPLVENAIARACETGMDWDIEVPFRRADGERIWVRAQGQVERENGRVVRMFGAFQDVTQRRHLVAELEQRSELLHVTLESIGEGVVTTDATGRITWMNPVAERLTGTKRDTCVGVDVREILSLHRATSREALPDPVHECLRSRQVYAHRGDAVLVSRDGSERAIEDSAAPITDKAGRVRGAVVVFRDVTEQRRLTEEMSYRASHDALTGLVNRQEFEHRLTQALQSAREEDVEHHLLYLDLDHFKVVNDTCGHTAGDELLVRVAALFTGAVRAQDTVARLGGDEFAIIVERCNSETAQRIAGNICQRVRSFRYAHGEQSFQIGASTGVVRIHRAWGSTSSLLQAADSACYAAKEAGRDGFHLYREDQAGALHARTRWAARLEEALDQDDLELYGQYVEGLGEESGEQALELLLRVRDADGRIALPGTFLPAAERYHLLPRLDRWVFERALVVLRETADGGPILFVTLSAAAVGDRKFHEFVVAHLERLAPRLRSRLALQVDERAAIGHPVEAARLLVAARTFGARTVLDDFGSAGASYGHLRELDLDYLKINGALVSSLVEEPLSRVAVKGLAEVARTLDLQIIAKHVESPEALSLLSELGITAVQGFLLHRPQRLDDLLAAAASGAGGGASGSGGTAPARSQPSSRVADSR